MNQDYSDLIHLPRHISSRHPPMDINNRAAQFAPYAALTGHKDIIARDESLATEKADPDNTVSFILDNES